MDLVPRSDQGQVEKQSQAQVQLQSRTIIPNVICDPRNCRNHQIQQPSLVRRHIGTRSDYEYSPIIMHKQRLTAKELRQQRIRIVMCIYKILMDQPIRISYTPVPRHHNHHNYRLFRCAIKMELKLFDGAESVHAHLNMQTLPQRVQYLYTSLLAHRMKTLII